MDKFYIQVVGSKQGKFKGPKPAPKPNGIEVHSFSFGISTPVDASTGPVVGRRKHRSVVIAKEVDSASPLFFKAIATNEALSVVLEEIDDDTGIAKEVFHLEDAVVAAVRPSVQFMQGSLGNKQWQDIVLSAPIGL